MYNKLNTQKIAKGIIERLAQIQGWGKIKGIFLKQKFLYPSKENWEVSQKFLYPPKKN
jgi:hypothetical protein